MLSCINECQATDVKATCRYYTWSNKQDGEQRVFSSIDRILANQSWLDLFEQAEVSFLPEEDFDHTPMLVCVYPDHNQKKPFRFLNLWCQYDELLDIVKNEWSVQINGCAMYRVVQKLKSIKKALREMKKKGCNDIEASVLTAKEKLKEVQQVCT